MFTEALQKQNWTDVINASECFDITDVYSIFNKKKFSDVYELCYWSKLRKSLNSGKNG